jgi:peroxiredoxin
MSILKSLTRRNFGIAAGMMTAVGLSAVSLITLSANAAPMLEAGTTAPAIVDAMTSTGETISLSDFAGKTVVLEWTNDGCPFVKKHYAEPVKNMQNLQADAAADDVVWVQVISSAEGKQGYTDGAGAIALNTERGSAPAYTIMDPTGVIGRAYGAKTTPHMYVINGDAQLVYSGAIDSKASGNVADIEGATNFVNAALDAIAAGEKPAVTYYKEYGCSIKY